MSTQEAGKQQTISEAGTYPPLRKLRIGMVGCGEVTQIMHWPSLYQLPDRYVITALCDFRPLVLEQLGKLWNVDVLTTDCRQLVSRSDVDALLVANPNPFHPEVTLDAIAPGGSANLNQRLTCETDFTFWRVELKRALIVWSLIRF